jgi:hypothetical protein
MVAILSKVDPSHAWIKNFHAAQRPLRGFEVMAMIKKGQMKTLPGNERSSARKFYALVA